MYQFAFKNCFNMLSTIPMALSHYGSISTGSKSLQHLGIVYNLVDGLSNCLQARLQGPRKS